MSKLEKLVQKGEEALNQKKYGRAINNFTYALEVDKLNFSIVSKRCFAFLQNSQFEEVIKDANRMIKLNSSDPQAYIYKGIALKNLKKFKQSKEIVKTGLEIDPDNTTLKQLKEEYTNFDKIDSEKSEKFKQIGNKFFNEGNLQEALENYNTSIEFNPMESSIYHNRGFLFQKNKEIEKSKQDYHKCIQLDKNYVKARFKLASIYFEEKNESKCLEVLREGLEMNPKEENLLSLFNVIFKKVQKISMENLTTAQESYFNKDLGNALTLCDEALNKFIEIGDKNGLEKGYNLLASIYFSMNNFSRASICYNECLKYQKELKYKEGEANTLNNLGTLCYTFHDDVNASLYFESAYKMMKEMKKDLKPILKNLVTVHFTLSKFQKSLDFSMELLKLSTGIEKISVLQSIGKCQKFMKEYENSINSYLKAFDLSKEYDEFVSQIQSLIGVGNCYEQLENFEKSIEYYEWSLEKSQENEYFSGQGESYENLGWAYYTMKEYSKSLSNFEKSKLMFLKMSNEQKVKTMDENIKTIKEKI
eukprot:gene3974-7230_t